MDLRTFEQQFSYLKTSHELLGCAVRARSRFGIRGNIARNAVLSAIQEDLRTDIFDLLSPFSAFELVVDDFRECPNLIGAVLGSIAYSRFYRWELDELAHVRNRISKEPHMISDELILWFDGRDSNGRIYADVLGNSEEIFDHDQFTFTPSAADMRQSPWDMVLTFLKQAYILASRSRSISERASLEFEQRGRSTARALSQSGLRPNSLQLQRAEISVLKLVASAISTELIPILMKSFRDGYRSNPLPGILHTITAGAVPKNLAAVVWKDDRLPGIQRRLLDLDGSKTPFHRPPWITLTSPESPCDCNHQDFSNGVAIAAWRGPIISSSRFQSLPLVGAAQAVRAGDDFDDEGKAISQDVMPIPAIVAIDQGLTMRFDHSYMASVFGRRLLIRVGVLPVENERGFNA
jgi:hypothetical protein